MLRHEEFTEGCKATCNGPYNGRWSKTMVGYGPEDNHFVAELTYNYGVGSYKLGNDLVCLTLSSSKAAAAARESSASHKVTEEGGVRTVCTEAPDGYRFHIKDNDVTGDADPVQSVTVGVSKLDDSIAFWKGMLGMEVGFPIVQRVLSDNRILTFFLRKR